MVVGVEEGLLEKASLVAGFREQARAGPSSKVGGGQLLGIKPGVPFRGFNFPPRTVRYLLITENGDVSLGSLVDCRYDCCVSDAVSLLLMFLSIQTQLSDKGLPDRLHKQRIG